MQRLGSERAAVHPLIFESHDLAVGPVLDDEALLEAKDVGLRVWNIAFVNPAQHRDKISSRWPTAQYNWLTKVWSMMGGRM